MLDSLKIYQDEEEILVCEFCGKEYNDFQNYSNPKNLCVYHFGKYVKKIKK